MSSPDSPKAPLDTEVLSLLEEIETLTSEVHFQTADTNPASEGVAEEAARIASDAERLVARRQEARDASLRILQGHRDRLLQALRDLEVLAAADAHQSETGERPITRI